MRYLRGVVLFTLTMLFLLYVYLLALLVLKRKDASGRARLVHDHAVFMLKLLGLPFRVEGTPCEGGALFVSNHVSFMDIPSLDAMRFGRFIAKKEIASWPLIGTITTGVDSLYIDRARARSIVGVNAAIAQSLKENRAVFVFAEGKTGNGTSLLPIRSNLLQPAIDAAKPVQPVAICYTYRGKLTDRASYCDRNIFSCLWEIVSTPGIEVTVKVCPALETRGTDRHELAKKVSASISAAMGVSDPMGA